MGFQKFMSYILQIIISPIVGEKEIGQQWYQEGVGGREMRGTRITEPSNIHSKVTTGTEKGLRGLRGGTFGDNYRQSVSGNDVSEGKFVESQQSTH